MIWTSGWNTIIFNVYIKVHIAAIGHPRGCQVKFKLQKNKSWRRLRSAFVVLHDLSYLNKHRALRSTVWGWDLLTSVILCVGAVAFWLLSVHYTENIPNADDFEVFLQFGNKVVHAEGFFQVFKLILARHNEHFVVCNRIAALALYGIFGEINFRALIAIGTLALPILLLLLYRTYLLNSNKRLLFLPVGCMLFQPTYVEATQWATAAFANLYVVIWALAALLCVERGGHIRSALAVGLCIVCTLTQGNGVLIWPAVAVLCFVQQRYLHGLLWGGVGGLLLMLFHSKSAQLTSAAFDGRDSMQMLLDYGVSFLGSAFGFLNHTYALIAGGILLGVVGYVTVCGGPKRSPVLYSFVIFLLLTAATNALARYPFGVHIAYTTSRYTFISLLIAIALYLLVLSIIQTEKARIRFARASFVGALAFCSTSYLLYADYYAGRAQLLLDSQLRWQLFQDGLAHPSTPHAKAILSSSLENKLLSLPQVEVDEFSIEPKQYPLTNLPQIAHKIEHYLVSAKHMSIDGWGFVQDKRNDDAMFSIVLTSEDAQFDIEMKPRVRPDVVAHFGRYDLKRAGFFTVVALSKIPKGTYDLSLVVHTGARHYATPTNLSLTVG